jgi:TatD DNase family protein
MPPHLVNYTDTHAHFGGDDATKIVARAVAAGVTRILAVGGNPDLNAGAEAAFRAEPNPVRLALGLDRSQSDVSADGVNAFESSLAAVTLCAIGEAGLDYHHDAATRSAQLVLFARMLDLAARRALPIIIHTREADEDTLAVIDEAGSAALAAAGRLGVVHCYTGGKAFARKLLDRGLYISFSGIVTFRNAEDLREVSAYVPADRLLIETDSPYLTPVPLRGQPNEPAFVPHVAACVARQRKIEPATLADLTTRNAEALFGAWLDFSATQP